MIIILAIVAFALIAVFVISITDGFKNRPF
jgi:hypothetical protein